MHDRHYICERCGTKWFVPATRPVPEALECGECGSLLLAVDDVALTGGGPDLLDAAED